MTETAKEYVTALFELAKETNSEEEFLHSLEKIAAEFRANPEYPDLLSSPNLSANEHNSLLEQAFAGHVPEYVLSFTELLCQNGHIREFETFVKEYKLLYTASREISSARILSVLPLTDTQKAALIKKLEKISGHTVTAQYEIDSSLLSGIVVYMDGTVIDGSLKQKLKEVKEVICI